MSIKRLEVKVYREYLLCDNYGETMKVRGHELLSDPPQFDHQCPKCGKTEQTRDQYYPRLIYVEQESI